MGNEDFISKAKKSIKERWTVDTIIKKLIEMLDQSLKAENILFKATYDMFFLYYPEAGAKLEEKEKFMEAVKSFSDRNSIREILSLPEDSMGHDLDKKDIDMIKDGVREIMNVRSLISSIEERINELVMGNYPNTYAVLGGVITARLISIAGSMQKLAMMPSSKVQILGTENTIFVRGKRTPKYGVIFKTQLVQSVDDSVKGKVAKTVAGYASLAIKTDIFSKEDKSKDLLRKLEEEVNKIRGNRKSNR